MGFKGTVLAALFLIMFLFISSEVATARELTQISGVEVAARKLIDISKTCKHFPIISKIYLPIALYYIHYIERHHIHLDQY